jgi:general secretion pathway protein K
MKKQSGVALVTVLLIVAMATTVMAFMAQQQAFWQREMINGRDRAQAAYIAQAGVDWARAVLADDKANNSYDTPREMWAMRLPAIPVEGGEIQGVLEDQQGLFNLNNLVVNGTTSALDVAHFQRLLAALGLPQELAYSLADWMDRDNTPASSGGAEDGYYLNQSKPYRAANLPLFELSELLWVRGFDAQIIQRLKGYVSVLPQRTQINVNFATAEVLSAVVDGLTLQHARQLVTQRKETPFKTVAEFMQQLQSGVGESSRGEISVSSEFFLVDGHATLEQGEYVAQALLYRQGIWATVVRQSVQ